MHLFNSLTKECFQENCLPDCIFPLFLKFSRNSFLEKKKIRKPSVQLEKDRKTFSSKCPCVALNEVKRCSTSIDCTGDYDFVDVFDSKQVQNTPPLNRPRKVLQSSKRKVLSFTQYTPVSSSQFLHQVDS